MGTKEKLIKRLLSHPKDFTFDEAVSLLHYLGFERSNKGRTSGSRVLFRRNDGGVLWIHMPHPGKVLHLYQVKELITMLRGEELI